MDLWEEGQLLHRRSSRTLLKPWQGSESSKKKSPDTRYYRACLPCKHVYVHQYLCSALLLLNIISFKRYSFLFMLRTYVLMQASYQRKAEETQRKHDMQIRSLHKQISTSREVEVQPKASADLSSGFIGTKREDEETQRFYQERLGLLETELMRTAEELGQVKRAHEDAAAKERADAFRLNDLSTTQQRLEIQVRLAQNDLLSSREELRACKEELRARKEECERYTDSERRLKLELASVSARLLDALQQPKTPSIAMFMNMETQLRHLEVVHSLLLL